MTVHALPHRILAPACRRPRYWIGLMALMGALAISPALAAKTPATNKAAAPAPKAAAAATPVAAKRQVIFLPFDVQIPGSYTHLRSGLASTLASRLASRANIAAAAQGSASEQMAQALKSGDHGAFSSMLQKSGADYLIMGSLAPKAGQFELTGYVFSQTSGQGPKKFQQDFQSVDDAMTAVDAMAWEISGAVFGRPKPDGLAGSTGNKGMGAFQTAHPEKAYREGLMAGSASGLEAGGPFELVSSFRSKGIPAEAMDVNAGDLDGDGKEEIVLLTKQALMLYRHENGAFRMLATVDLPNHLRYHALTLGDINHNGLQEIYISGSNGDNPEASAMEWNGKKLTTLFERAPWYLAAINAPGQAPLLVGQQRLASEFGGGDIFTMQLTKSGVVESKTLPIPKGINIFDFTLADIDADGASEIIAVNSTNRLQVFDNKGGLRWTSGEIHGASNNFFGTLTSANNAANADKETVWVHTRVVAADLDFDGTSDILVGSNRLESVNFMPNLRYFDGSSLSAFHWQQGSMGKLWETKKIPGYITNYQVTADKQSGNQYRIFFAETESSYPFVFWQSSSSYLNGYTLRVNGAPAN